MTNPNASDPCGSCNAPISNPGLEPTPVVAGRSRQQFRISTMDCASEESEIRHAVDGIAGIAAMSFQLGARTMAIEAPPAVVEQALAAIRKAGFDPQPLPVAESGVAGATPSTSEPPAMFTSLHRMVLALVLAVVAEAIAYFLSDGTATTVAEMVLALAAIWLAGFDTYKKGLASLRRGRLNITALMTVAVTGAFLIGQWPEAAMVMALYSIAELIEARSLDRARNAIQSLMALTPEKADVRQPDGSWVSLPATEIPLEAVVRIRPGARLPLDGLVTAGNSAIDQSPVTGKASRSTRPSAIPCSPAPSTSRPSLSFGSLRQPATPRWRESFMRLKRHRAREHQPSVSSIVSPRSTRLASSCWRSPWRCYRRGWPDGPGWRPSTRRWCCW